MWEMQELLRCAMMNIVGSSMSQIHGINLNKLTFHFLLQAVFTRMEINLKLEFSYCGILSPYLKMDYKFH